MTPYQLFENGPWLDLDTIQGIDPPEFVDRMGHGGYFIQLRWYHAFQEGPRVYEWKQEACYVKRDLDDPEIETRGTLRLVGPRLSQVQGFEDKPDQLPWVEESVYKPFLAAWMDSWVQRQIPVKMRPHEFSVGPARIVWYNRKTGELDETGPGEET